jgi:hypothetical protein
MNTIARLLNLLFLLTILIPAEGATLSGVVRLTATTHYFVPGVATLKFLVDGQPACQAHRLAAPYNHRWTCSWDSRSVGDGDHTITAEAFSSSGALVERTDMKMAEK